MDRTTTLFLITALFFGACGTSTGQEPSRKQQQGGSANPYYSTTDATKLNVPLSEWQRILPPDLYHVAFEKGTERPFTGKFEGEHKDGVFRCAVCGYALFDPKTKFESGSGWPSFYAPLKADRIADKTDLGLGMIRDEVLCARCGAHLGHVFEDGPKPTGLRYCINAVSLELGKE